jgi:hypothetical protein
LSVGAEAFGHLRMSSSDHDLHRCLLGCVKPSAAGTTRPAAGRDWRVTGGQGTRPADLVFAPTSAC